MGEARHFKWDALPKVRRVELVATNAALRSVASWDGSMEEGARRVFEDLGLAAPLLDLRWVGAARAEGFGHAVTFRLRMPGASNAAVLAVDFGLADAVLAALVGGPSTGMLFDDSDFGVLAYIVARVLAEATREGLPPVIVDVERRDNEHLARDLGEGWLTEFAAQFGFEGYSGWARLFVPGMWFQTMSPSVSLDRVSFYAARDVVFDAPLSIARVGLTTWELRELAPGDVVLFDMPAFFHPEALGAQMALAPEVSLAVSLSAENRWAGRILEERMTQETVETTQKIGRAEVAVELVVGRVQLTLESLAVLAPGQVVVTESRVGDAVELVAAGTPVARGELVDVEGALGVRVLALL